MAVTVTVQPTEQMWQQFYAAHYAADHRLKLRFWYGLACLCLGAFGLGGLFPSKLAAALLLVFGLYCVLSRHILLVRSLRKLRGNPHAARPVTYRLDVDGLSASGEQGTTEKRWADFSGYRLAAPGLLLYLHDGSFLFLPQAGVEPDSWVELQRLLARSRLPQR